MNRIEAIAALKEGKKITHRHFGDNEFIYCKDQDTTVIYMEDENFISAGIFWKDRSNSTFDNDWEIFE